MLLNFILLFTIIFAILLLYRQLRKPNIDNYLIPTCEFSISKPHFEINGNIRKAKYAVYSKNKDRYFQDFPIAFKFYSNNKFTSSIKISYSAKDNLEHEIIYDQLVEFENKSKEHIYYINDIIIGKINIEIDTVSKLGKPSIEFEILQGSSCHMEKEHKLNIVFPE